MPGLVAPLQAELSVKSYCNGVLVQTRKDYSDVMRNEGVTTDGLNLGKEYGWVRRQNDKKVSNVISMSDQKKEYTDVLNDLASAMPKDY